MVWCGGVVGSRSALHWLHVQLTAPFLRNQTFFARWAGTGSLATRKLHTDIIQIKCYLITG